MTVRLRLLCAGQMSEYAFDRTRITVGRGPFHDVVVSSAEVASKHGAIVFNAQESLTFELEPSGSVTTLVRNAEIVEEHYGREPATWSLQPGDFVLLGGDRARLEILEASTPQPPTWSLHECPEAASLDEVRAGALMAWVAELSRAPESVEVGVRGVATLATAFSLPDITRCDLSIYTTSEEFLDDIFGFRMERHVGLGDETSEHFGVTRDPLEKHGPGVSSRLRPELERSLGFAVMPRVGASGIQVFFCVHQADTPVALVALTWEKPPRDFDALATLVWAVRPGLSTVVRAHRDALEARSLAEENRYFRDRERRHYLFKELVCESPAMRAVYERLGALFEVDDPIFVLGSPGSGKELLARALHHLGSRRDGMFISLHCGRLSQEVLGVELFGCVANEIAGAVAPRKGIFELASDGTVYLEEVDRLSPVMQGKLARMLKEKEVRRLGDSVGRRVNARLVVSTHHPIDELLSSGHMRHDLYLLLKEHLVEVPCLRQRREDLMPLARSFLKSLAERHHKAVVRFEPDVEEILLTYDWPGNVRELQSFVEAAVLRAAPGALTITRDELSILRVGDVT